MKGKLRKKNDNWFVEYTEYKQVYPKSGRDAGGNEKYEYVDKTINYYPVQEEMIKAETNLEQEVEFSLGYKTKNDYYNNQNPHAIINWNYSDKPNWDDVRMFMRKKIVEQGMTAEYVDYGICINILEAYFEAPQRK